MFVFTPVRLAAAAVFGVAVSLCFGITVVLAVAAIAAVTAVILIFCRKQSAALLIFAAVFAAAGASYAVNSGEIMHKSVNYIGRYAEIRGTVLTQGMENTYDDNLKYTVRVSSIEKGGVKNEIRDNILLTTPEKLECGSNVVIRGIIKDMPAQMNENGPDTAKYYRSQGIFSRIYSEEVTSEGDSGSVSPLILTGKFREAVDNVIYKYYSGDGAAVLSAVLTGNFHHFSAGFDDVLSSTAFKRMYHPAYLHVFLIVSLIGLFARFIPRRARDIAVIVVLLIYALLNSSGVGFVRCLLTAAVTVFFRMKNGSAYYPDTLAWLLAACGIFMPLMLFNAGFVMSLSAGMLIWAFAPYVEKKMRSLPRRLRRTASVMVICAVFQTPLAAYYFNGVCIYAFIAPFIMAPLTLFVLVLAPVTLAVMSAAGNAFILKAYLDMALFVMIKLPYVIEMLPLSKLTVPTPSASAMAAMILAVFAVYYYVKKSDKKIIFTSAACGMAAAAAAVSLTRLGTADMTFVNVGQGDGAVIRTYLGDTVLIDGGGGSSFSDYDPGEAVFVPFLESKGYSVIEAAFVSHYHKDHVQGIIAAMKSLRVKNVFVPARELCIDEDMQSWADEIERTAEENGTKLHVISEDITVRFMSGLDITVYVPGETARVSDDGNDMSLLIKTEYGGVSSLYTGDMTDFTEKCALDEGIDVDADILKVAHHGSKTSSSKEFIDAVSPEYSVISCGENNSYGHPSNEALERLKGTNVLRTDMNGTVTFRVGRDKIKNAWVFKE